MLDAVRRRTTAAHRLRRGRKGDPEWINRRRLLRAAERLTDEQRHKLFEKLTSAVLNDTHTNLFNRGQVIAVCSHDCRAPIRDRSPHTCRP